MISPTAPAGAPFLRFARFFFLAYTEGMYLKQSPSGPNRLVMGGPAPETLPDADAIVTPDPTALRAAVVGAITAPRRYTLAPDARGGDQILICTLGRTDYAATVAGAGADVVLAASSASQFALFAYQADSGWALVAASQPPTGLQVNALLLAVDNGTTTLPVGVPTPILESGTDELIASYTKSYYGPRFDKVSFDLGFTMAAAGNVTARIQGRVRNLDGTILYDWYDVGQNHSVSVPAGSVAAQLTGYTAVDSSFNGNDVPSITDYRVRATAAVAIATTTFHRNSILLESLGLS